MIYYSYYYLLLFGFSLSCILVIPLEKRLSTAPAFPKFGFSLDQVSIRAVRLATSSSNLTSRFRAAAIMIRTREALSKSGKWKASSILNRFENICILRRSAKNYKEIEFITWNIMHIFFGRLISAKLNTVVFQHQLDHFPEKKVVIVVACSLVNCR